MKNELNMAHGHENPHAIPLDSTLDSLEKTRTTNLERMHLLPEVVRLLSSSDVTNRLLLWLEPRLIFRSDRALHPKGLVHWSSQSFHSIRLAVRAAEESNEFDTLLFRVMKPVDIPGKVYVSILDWRTFRSGHDAHNEQGVPNVFDHIDQKSDGFDCIVDCSGMIRIHEDALLDHPDILSQKHHVSDVLTWFGKLIADPSAFDTVDLSLDDEFWG